MNRAISMLAVTTIMLSLSSGILAQDYPNKPIRMIIPSNAGSSVDPAAHVIGNALSRLWGQRIIMENRGGAAGTIGQSEVAHSAPDGYTLMFTTSSAVVSPHTIDDLPFDPATAFTGITHVATLPIALVSGTEVPVDTIPELIERAKAQPGRLTFGSGGEGSTNDLAAVVFAQLADIEILRVPYNGAANAMTAMMGGEIDFVFASTANVVPFVSEGLMKPIGVTTVERQDVLPGVQAIQETVPGYEVTNWYAIVAPAGVPDDVIERWREAILEIKEDPEIQEFYANAGAILVLSTPEEMSAKFTRDYASWGEIFARMNAGQ